MKMQQAITGTSDKLIKLHHGLCPTEPSVPNGIKYLWTFFGQDTLLLSLHNFLSLVFARLPPPRLADFQSTATKLKRLKEENDVLRQTLIKQRQQQAADG